MHINLPKINIKSFGGDPLQWLTFWDSFSAAIDKNHGLSDIEKMNYLNGMLKGEAARAISGLPLTEENYKKAIALLKERFGKPQILTNAYMESLSKIDAPPADTKPWCQLVADLNHTKIQCFSKGRLMKFVMKTKKIQPKALLVN